MGAITVTIHLQLCLKKTQPTIKHVTQIRNNTGTLFSDLKQFDDNKLLAISFTLW